MAADRIEAINALLVETQQAHGAYEAAELNGVYDQDWPRWYAAYAVEHGISALAEHDITTDELAAFLASSYAEFQQTIPTCRHRPARSLCGIAAARFSGVTLRGRRVRTVIGPTRENSVGSRPLQSSGDPRSTVARPTAPGRCSGSGGRRCPGRSGASGRPAWRASRAPYARSTWASPCSARALTYEPVANGSSAAPNARADAMRSSSSAGSVQDCPAKNSTSVVAVAERRVLVRDLADGAAVGLEAAGRNPAPVDAVALRRRRESGMRRSPHRRARAGSGRQSIGACRGDGSRRRCSGGRGSSSGSPTHRAGCRCCASSAGRRAPHRGRRPRRSR